MGKRSEMLPTLFKRALPSSKLVFILCDPSERIVSQYFHYHRDQETFRYAEKLFHKRAPRLGFPKTFEDFIQTMDPLSNVCKNNREDCNAIQHKFHANGKYYLSLQKWLKVYNTSDLLILDMNAPGKENAKRLLKF